MHLDLAVKGVALVLIWSQSGRKRRWQLQQREHGASTWNKLEQNMLRKCFKIQKSYVRWAPRKALEFWLSDEILAKEINLINLVHSQKLEWNKIQAYQPPPLQVQSHRIWVNLKVAEIGIGLREVNHFQEGKSHKTTICLLTWSPTSDQHPNKGNGAFSKGMYKFKSREGRKWERN